MSLSAISKNIDNVIIDTAGRLQTQKNLNNELIKIVKVCSKAQENAPHQKLMILDGTQGNTAIAQAQAFNEMVGIDGIIVTKLDGTAKGGALFSISNQLELPIFFVGVGEKQDDLTGTTLAKQLLIHTFSQVECLGSWFWEAALA